MRIIFCDSGFSHKEVEYMYRAEYAAAKQHNIPTSLISFEALQKGNIDWAVRRVRRAFEEETAIYRGWMLKPFQYKQLYDALLTKNLKLINTPASYQFCHYLPDNYKAIHDFTPKTVFKKLEQPFNITDFKADLTVFGKQPIIVKDYVKSQKHYWTEACFIPNASDLEQVEKVTKRFLELQEDDLNEGLVYRAFVPLKKLTTHSKSGMPLTKEFRLFIKNHEIIACFKYWDEGDYSDLKPDLSFFKPILQRIKSNFFTMDIAQTEDGEWIIVELGDGQVAGLADHVDRIIFYERLLETL